ncbi:MULTISPECIES: beta-ketoacyl synthase N-terminal-like domain-containing protein [unclassified Pseudomonas]|uniref:beta-ketoacyl synthase N-terminal-like domain-containing protein n=1 Tax=unclassified Pseudomonas TaxID=196821 RepID=UPI0008DFC23A|nr:MULTISPECIES: polyketide synthase [unclassified Pseudomonas]PMV23874.1 polyketide synthase [Pseudomonas sp. FW305-3-2-15-C-TSA2]PMV30541.1 polyketide synthase [Pseudomonas sp. DP16D-L5]PMV40747.1 polyketide synthase [Pseudomonas sp. FW305-3-2-15-A-LB2]PMV47607.1 polyketide synthase [Pseudomonas sp. FW305-3-2-15-C-R2A1]PMV53027.1 polyketide synthase [Pseudomonas sp. FW305-3-2-15-C-LB1]
MDVAIVGMGCRFPGASGLASFIELLRSGARAVTDYPQDRFGHLQGSLEALSPDMLKGGFLPNIKLFDWGFFNLCKEEADHLDPQQRLLLEVSWEALENGGIEPASLRKSRTGVFVGATNADYHRMVFADHTLLSKFSASGTALGTAANRLSYFYDWIGPSQVVDTGCSSSLVALDSAVGALKRGEIDMAVVGGVNCILHPNNTLAHFHAGILSADGACHSFDDAANGYVRSEGCGVVILQRQPDAVAARRKIWALISATAVNHDGASNGFTAPNAQAQKRLIQEAFAASDHAVADLCYVETHTTGTLMGDAVELKVLNDIVRLGAPNDSVKIGSVKTNIGHLESASGMASLIKVACMAYYREFYPTCGYTTPNRFYKYEAGQLRVSMAHEPAPSIAHKCLGVSTFSFGGTNAFALLKSAAPSTAPDLVAQPEHVFVLSARSSQALVAQLKKLLECLPGYLDEDLPQLCRELLCREKFRFRVAMVAYSVGELAEKIRTIAALPAVFIVESQKRKPLALCVRFTALARPDRSRNSPVPQAFEALVGTRQIAEVEHPGVRNFLACLSAVERLRAFGLLGTTFHYEGLGRLVSAYCEQKATPRQLMQVLTNQGLLANYQQPGPTPAEAPLLYIGEPLDGGARSVYTLADDSIFSTVDLPVLIQQLFLRGYALDSSGVDTQGCDIWPLAPSYQFDHSLCWYT